MSIIATVYIPEGIIMAADSRITGFLQNDKFIDRYSLSDNAQKLFLVNNGRTGIAACGDAKIANKTVANFIRLFEIEQIKEGDSTDTIASKLMYYTMSNHGEGVVYHVAGYDGESQSVYSIHNGLKDQINFKERELVYGASWDGDIVFLSNLLNGMPPMTMDWDFMYLKDGIEFAEFLIDVNCKAQRFSQGVATCGGPIDILLLTKDGSSWIRHKISKPQ